MNKLTALREHLGYNSIKEFADFIGIKYQTVQKWEKRGNLPDIKNLAIIAGKISGLNMRYFTSDNEPMFIYTNVQNVQSEPLSGGNQTTLEDYRERVRQLESENANLKKKIERLKELNYGLIEHIHDYLQSSNNLKHPANERTKKQPTLTEHG